MTIRPRRSSLGTLIACGANRFEFAKEDCATCGDFGRFLAFYVGSLAAMRTCGPYFDRRTV